MRKISLPMGLSCQPLAPCLPVLSLSLSLSFSLYLSQTAFLCDTVGGIWGIGLLALGVILNKSLLLPGTQLLHWTTWSGHVCLAYGKNRTVSMRFGRMWKGLECSAPSGFYCSEFSALSALPLSASQPLFVCLFYFFLY